MEKSRSHTTEVKVKLFNITKPLLESMYKEFKELSKKKPDASVNKNKIKIVNRLLEKLRTILADEDTIEFLDLLDEDDMPQTSDVTLMLSQYDTSMDSFRKKYTRKDGYKSVWKIEGLN